MDNLSKNTRVQPCAGVDNLEGLSFFIGTSLALNKISEEPMVERQKNKTLHIVKTVGLVILIFVLINFLFETIITIIESQVAVSLYGIFPFTRIILLVLTIVIYRRYAWKKRAALEHKA